jgi:hypothetical protein
MPITYDVDARRRLVRLVAEGTPTFDEWRAALDAAAADPRYAAGFDLLYDRRQVPTVPHARAVRRWTMACAAELARVGAGRLAIVAAHPVVYGMMRMASVFAEGSGSVVDVFWTEEEALRWLGHDTEGGRT